MHAACRYLGFVIGRYNERFNNCCKTNGNMTSLTIVASAALATEPTAAYLLMRWAMLQMHMYYMMLDGPLSQAHWQVLHRRGLVTQAERDALDKVAKKPLHVMVWACRLLDALERAGKLSAGVAFELRSHIKGLRGLAAKQIAYHLTPLPMPFFHYLSWSNHLYLLVLEWNSAVRFAVSVRQMTYDESGGTKPLLLLVEVVGLVFCILAFNSPRSMFETMHQPTWRADWPKLAAARGCSNPHPAHWRRRGCSRLPRI